MRTLSALIVVVAAAFTPPALAAGNEPLEPDWYTRIRDDHPRMFFNADTFPAVKQYALTHESAYYTSIKKRVAAMPGEPDRKACESGSNPKYGGNAQCAAFVWLMEKDPDALAKARTYLLAGVEFYNRRSSARKAVNWYSLSRVCAMTAYDWIYNELTPAERKTVATGFFRHYRDCLAGTRFERQNRSDHTSGFYGPTNMAWYIGLAFHGDGIDDAQAARLLKKGYAEHVKLLTYRSQAAGDDGGMGTVAAGYAFGMYPWSEFNFMHTYHSATGLKIEDSFDHMSLLPEWVAWNHQPGHGRFGMGDSTPGGKFFDGFLEMHMMQIAHFYAERYPTRASQALWVRKNVLADQRHDNYWWPVAPLLIPRAADVETPADSPVDRPAARNFENMGTIFFRSSEANDATCAMFVAGGSINNHRHYDQGHFAIYRKGHLTGASGHYGHRRRNEHLTEYFYRTVAANSILITAPRKADRPAIVWGGPARTLDGGQFRHAGRQLAFETCDEYSYAAVDMKQAYFPAKCTQAVRQFAFIHPDTIVVCDRVASARGDYRKAWLLHSVDAPTVTGDTIVIESPQSRLTAQVIEPSRATIESTGGPGKEFSSAGVNYPQVGKPNPLAGAWRVEVTPAKRQKADLFLHVLRTSDAGAEPAGEVTPVRTPRRVGAKIAQPSGNTVTILFNKVGPVGGNINVTGTRPFNRALTTKVQPQAVTGE